MTLTSLQRLCDLRKTTTPLYTIPSCLGKFRPLPQQQLGSTCSGIFSLPMQSVRGNHSDNGGCFPGCTGSCRLVAEQKLCGFCSHPGRNFSAGLPETQLHKKLMKSKFFPKSVKCDEKLVFFKRRHSSKPLYFSTDDILFRSPMLKYDEKSFLRFSDP